MEFDHWSKLTNSFIMPVSITTARRAREFAAREELIIREARKFLLERGFQGWNMDDLAHAV